MDLFDIAKEFITNPKNFLKTGDFVIIIMGDDPIAVKIGLISQELSNIVPSLKEEYKNMKRKEFLSKRRVRDSSIRCQNVDYFPLTNETSSNRYSIRYK